MKNIKRYFMQNNTDKIEEADSTFKEAFDENRVEALYLIDEIKILLDDYFVGDFIRENSLVIRLLNGQKFRLTLEEI